MSMMKQAARRVLRSMGYEVFNARHPRILVEDGLATHHNFSFVDDPRFKAAYARGVTANGGDHHIRWRAHVALWVARQVAGLDGAFVECGVSTGFLSSAIMHDLDWNRLGKKFYLFDTYAGLDARFMSEAELTKERLGWYSSLSYDAVKKNFAEFGGVELVKGSIPETLGTVDIPTICYLSLDMNCTLPEIAAAEHFWPKLVPGGIMLLDDYAYSGYEEQHEAFDALAAKFGTTILSLPTGQGILQKACGAR